MLSSRLPTLELPVKEAEVEDLEEVKEETEKGEEEKNIDVDVEDVKEVDEPSPSMAEDIIVEETPSPGTITMKTKDRPDLNNYVLSNISQLLNYNFI